MEKAEKKNVKRLRGVVTSDKMDKTAVVSVNRYVKHPKYGKYQKISKKYSVHDEANEVTVGDEVTIEETVRMSKNKAFKIVKD